MDKPEDVDAYIANADERARSHLVELRRVILETVPGVAEAISWGVPFYRYHGALVGLAAYKKHVSFGIGEGVLGDQIRAKLERDGYTTGKKTFQIGFEQAVPVEAVAGVLRAQAEANERKRP